MDRSSPAESKISQPQHMSRVKTVSRRAPKGQVAGKVPKKSLALDAAKKRAAKVPKKTANPGGKRAKAPKKRAARGSKEAEKTYEVYDGRRFEVYEGWTDPEPQYVTDKPEIYKDRMDGYMAWQFPPRDLISTDSGWDEGFAIRIVCVDAANWITNNQKTDWIALVEWLPKDKTENTPLLAWLPLNWLPAFTVEVFASNVDPACIHRSGLYLVYSRVWPTKAYTAIMLQIAACVIHPNPSEAAGYLRNHPHYVLDGKFVEPVKHRPEYGERWKDDPILKLPPPPKENALEFADKDADLYHKELSEGVTPSALQELCTLLTTGNTGSILWCVAQNLPHPDTAEEDDDDGDDVRDMDLSD